MTGRSGTRPGTPTGASFWKSPGTWLESLDPTKANEGKLWAWAEWEPESRVLCQFAPSGDGLPSYLWEPTWLPKESYRGLHNTDPLVFDGFYYSNCKQQAFKGLRQLGRGSVMVFGSREGEQEESLLGSGHGVLWSPTTWTTPIRTMGNVSQEGCPNASRTRCCLRIETPGLMDSRRWYRGATYDEPVDGMFSFFPCVPAEIENPFPRPRIELPQAHFTPSLAPGRQRMLPSCSSSR